MSIFGKTRLKFARVLLLPVFFGFQNSLTSARINIFWSGKKHLVADTPLCQKQQNIWFRPSLGWRPPSPLKFFSAWHLLLIVGSVTEKLTKSTIIYFAILPRRMSQKFSKISYCFHNFFLSFQKYWKLGNKIFCYACRRKIANRIWRIFSTFRRILDIHFLLNKRFNEQISFFPFVPPA